MPGTEGLSHLPFELWNMLLGFVKHDALPVLMHELAHDGWDPEEDESGESDAEGEDEWPLTESSEEDYLSGESDAEGEDEVLTEDSEEDYL
jgi:hypothetical protein